MSFEAARSIGRIQCGRAVWQARVAVAFHRPHGAGPVWSLPSEFQCREPKLRSSQRLPKSIRSWASTRWQRARPTRP